MKKLLIAALVAGQIATPAVAQNYSPVRDAEIGTFGGLRVRIPFGGSAREPVSAGLAFAPISRTEHLDGRVRTRIGEGLEFGFNGRGPAQFSLARTPINQFVRGHAGPEGRRQGISTLGWIAIGVGGTIVILFAAAAICLSDSYCIPDE
jgi:hypothetical protein